MRRLDLHDVLRCDEGIPLREVIQHGAFGFLVQEIHDAAAVVAHGAGEGQLACSEIGYAAAPAKTYRAHAPRMFDYREGGGEILDDLIALQLFHVAEAFLHRLLVVAELNAAPHAVE